VFAGTASRLKARGSHTLLPVAACADVSPATCHRPVLVGALAGMILLNRRSFARLRSLKRQQGTASPAGSSRVVISPRIPGALIDDDRVYLKGHD
jgi:hypothetical protein